MGVEHIHLTKALVILILPVILCKTWNVDYKQEHICAVRGSSVVIHCSYSYPHDTVTKVMWGHEMYRAVDGPFIFASDKTDSSTKFQYIGNKYRNCSFKINHVEYNDTGKYTFRFLTESEKWTGMSGSTLNVTELKALVTPRDKQRMMEGESVNLTCVNPCDGGNSSSAITWFKNGQPINEGQVLHISNMSSKDSGSYTCSLRQRSGTLSEVISIDVEYGPKNTSVFVRSSTEVDVGGNVSLICSSYANPPVENYTWFAIKDGSAMAVGYQSVYDVVSGDGGQYLCSVKNKHGSQNSSTVTHGCVGCVGTKGTEETVTRNILVTAFIVMLLIVPVAAAIKRLHKKRMNTPKTDKDNIQNATTYVNWPMSEYNQSRDEGQSDSRTFDVIYTTVHIASERKADVEQEMDANNDPVIYSSVQESTLTLH